MSALTSASLAQKELSRLGGLAACLKLLECSSKKKSLQETAALVLATATHENEGICRQLISLAADAAKGVDQVDGSNAGMKGGITLIIEKLRGGNNSGTVQ